MIDPSQRHWSYFLLLEKDLVSISEYLELTEANYPAYGPRILQFILSCGGELDIVLRALCSKLIESRGDTHRKAPRDMGGYRQALAELAGEQFTNAQVVLSYSDVVLTPWKGALENTQVPLEWWHAYTKLKHERDTHYNLANLGNALSIYSALLIANGCYQQATESTDLRTTQMSSLHMSKLPPNIE